MQQDTQEQQDPEKTGNLKLVADTLDTIKQASKYAKTMHSDVIEIRTKHSQMSLYRIKFLKEIV